jgi:hypothetical protein
MRLTYDGATGSLGLPLPNISAFTRVFDAQWGREQTLRVAPLIAPERNMLYVIG